MERVGDVVASAEADAGNESGGVAALPPPEALGHLAALLRRLAGEYRSLGWRDAVSQAKAFDEAAHLVESAGRELEATFARSSADLGQLIASAAEGGRPERAADLADRRQAWREALGSVRQLGATVPLPMLSYEVSLAEMRAARNA